MVPTHISGQQIFSFRGATSLSRLLAPGSVVRVEIMGNAPGGGTFVRIAGQTYTSSSLSGFSRGDVLSAKVEFSGNTVFLHPVAAPDAAVPSSVFSRLGLESGPAAAALVSFYQNINAPLDGRVLNPLLKIASRFPGKEQRAAEAAAILEERGIEPLFESVERLIRCIEGRSGTDGGTDGEGADRDFLSFINHKKGQALHWIIIPFTKQLSLESCSGSVRFLIDSAAGKHLETRMTCFVGNHSWEFTLKGKDCSFSSDPSFNPVQIAEFVVYLKNILAGSGFADVFFNPPGSVKEPELKPVDLEI